VPPLEPETPPAVEPAAEPAASTPVPPPPSRWRRLLGWARASRMRLALCLALVPVILALLILLWVILSCPSVEFLKTTNPETTALIEHRQAQGKAPKKLASLRRSWVPLGAIPDLLQKTVLVSEDASFYQHNGVDWHEVREAFKKNFQEGRVVRGASTITQQLAKNLFLSERRSLLRKVREWILTRRLESSLGKTRILDLYFNCIEYGPGIFGIGRAAGVYFAKTPADLEVDEMVRLVAAIPAPLKTSPTRPSKGLEFRALNILKRLYRFGYITEQTFYRNQERLTAFFSAAHPAAPVPAPAPAPAATPSPAPTQPVDEP
jgi:monofunctional glycosyltransferase